MESVPLFNPLVVEGSSMCFAIVLLCIGILLGFSALVTALKWLFVIAAIMVLVSFISGARYYRNPPR